MQETFKAAAVQAAPVFLDREATLEKACRLVEEAASRGASLVVFPETWVPGYPVWASRVPAWRVWKPGQRAFARLFRNAVEVPGPATDALGAAARRTGVYLVIGVNEREAEFGRGTLYNTILFFGRDGRLLGRHRKLMPTFHERTVWGLGDASGLAPHATQVGRLGGLICWEHWMPLARYALYTQGEQVHAALWPSSYGLDSVEGEMVQTASRHYAHEGRTFVVAACGYLTRDMLPRDFDLGDEAARWPQVLLTGGSAIIAPDGRYLAGPFFEGEGILYADINLEEIPQLKQSLDVAGHYARPDIFQVTVNRSRQAPARIVGAPEPALRPEEEILDEL
ncbi:MAG: carbon-nitrogen hydrolase family protein [Chloroflexi bacterium]|nr:carbon-nitrogen hydrolase family protein [Chloroflexota bacterium]